VLGDRLRHAQGSPGSLITAALSGPVPDTLPADEQPWDLAGIWPGPPTPPLTTRAVIEAEREVLTACLTDPNTRDALLGWLTPEDFSRPEHAATWAAFTALTTTGTPIDYVTLAWECQRHHPDYDSPGLRADQLATMAAHTPPWRGSRGPDCCPCVPAAPDPHRPRTGPGHRRRPHYRRSHRRLRRRRRLSRRRTPRPATVGHRGKPGQRRPRPTPHPTRATTTPLAHPITDTTT
jgi:hypothetical protein